LGLLKRKNSKRKAEWLVGPVDNDGLAWRSVGRRVIAGTRLKSAVDLPAVD
jgi:hypothetical protein